MSGSLYLISTPIGNLEDITLRALRILSEVDIVAAEDTRHSAKLLSHHKISAKLTSFHAYNEHSRCAGLIEEVLKGRSVALISDAGTPAIADPGFLLVREAVKAGIEPVIVPGASALTFAVTAAALPADEFAFYGFPPVKSGRKRSFFERIKNEDKSCFIYESPHRLDKTLQLIAEVIGADTSVVLIKEATKIHEKVWRSTAGELAAEFALLSGKIKGEYVIGILPPKRLS